MDAVTVLEAGAAVVAVCAVVFSAGRFTQSVQANTKVTEKLGQIIDGHLTWSAQVVREHDERFHEHDTRIARVEERLERRR